jgi:hypothetical protein
MKSYGGVDVLIRVFLTSAHVSGEWWASRSDRFSFGERAPDTHWLRGCVGPRSGLDDMENWKFLTLLGLELQLPCRPYQNNMYINVNMKTHAIRFREILCAANWGYYDQAILSMITRPNSVLPQHRDGAERSELKKQFHGSKRTNTVIND